MRSRFRCMELVELMKKINKDGVKRKLDIKFIHKKTGPKLQEILKDGYLSYLSNLKAR